MDGWMDFWFEIRERVKILEIKYHNNITTKIKTNTKPKPKPKIKTNTKTKNQI